MNTNDQPPQTSEYQCPGEQHPISRAVHLGRLAVFYPACRQCPHRDDTGTLAPRKVEQLQEVRLHHPPRPLFNDEGAGGVYLNELTPANARDIATAFGTMTKAEGGGRKAEGDSDEWRVENGGGATDLPSPFGRGAGGEGTRNPLQHAFAPTLSQTEKGPDEALIASCSVILGGDGRSITAEISAAVGEGLRFAGCNVVDIGPATAACLGFAVHAFQAAGGILVGNPGVEPHVVGLQFWAAGPRPLSAGAGLEAIAERYQAGAERPTRNYGTLSRAQADVAYLAVMGEHYHALRPLRVVVDSASRPLVEHLQQLAAAVACQVIPCRVAQCDLAEQVRTNTAHVAARIDGDGETCRVLDEQGQIVPTERLLLFLARQFLTQPTDIKPQQRVVVLERGTSPVVVERLERLTMAVVIGGVRRAEMAAAMSEHAAAFGGGPSGRFWHQEAGIPLPDALMTITRLLVLLSRSDEPFSVVLDREAPWG